MNDSQSAGDRGLLKDVVWGIALVWHLHHDVAPEVLKRASCEVSTPTARAVSKRLLAKILGGMTRTEAVGQKSALAPGQGEKTVSSLVSPYTHKRAGTCGTVTLNDDAAHWCHARKRNNGKAPKEEPEKPLRYILGAFEVAGLDGKRPLGPSPGGCFDGPTDQQVSILLERYRSAIGAIAEKEQAVNAVQSLLNVVGEYEQLKDACAPSARELCAGLPKHGLTLHAFSRPHQLAGLAAELLDQAPRRNKGVRIRTMTGTIRFPPVAGVIAAVVLDLLSEQYRIDEAGDGSKKHLKAPDTSESDDSATESSGHLVERPPRSVPRPVSLNQRVEVWLEENADDVPARERALVLRLLELVENDQIPRTSEYTPNGRPGPEFCKRVVEILISTPLTDEAEACKEGRETYSANEVATAWHTLCKALGVARKSPTPRASKKVAGDTQDGENHHDNTK